MLTPAGADTAQTAVRVFTGRTSIEEIAPANVTAGDLLYLRGDGFDGEALENNVVLLGPAGVACADAEEGPCVQASVFWATRGLVMALVPADAPDGPLEVHYENRAFLCFGAAAEAWSEAGRDMSEFFAGEQPPEPMDDPDDAVGYAGAIDMGESASNAITVWSDPGLLTARRKDDVLLVSGEGRLCYHSEGKEVPQLRVLLDGHPVFPELVSCDLAEPKALEVDLSRAHLGPDGVRMAVQVTTPFHQSPVTWAEEL